MATEIGTGTSYPITIPAGTDPADIQTALRYISYGIASTPTTNSDITSNSIFGKMSLLAPKANPVFTGNVSVGNNLTIGGNLTITGSIDVLSSTNALIKDKKVILGGDGAVTTDAGADGGGIQLSGTTNKTFVWIDGTDSWTSSENMDLATGKDYKIAGSSVLSATSVLGILGSNIATLSGAQTITGAKTFTGPTQTINGITFDNSGGISRTLVNNEWVPIVSYKPSSPVVYPFSSSSKIGMIPNGNQGVRSYDGNGDPINEPLYDAIYRVYLSNISQDAPLLPNQIVYIYSEYGSLEFKVLDSPVGYVTVQTQGVKFFNDSYTPILFSPMVDYYSNSSIQEWKYGGVDGTVAAKITSDGTVESLNGFKDIGKTYHTNSGVPYFNVGLYSSTDKVFSITTGLTSPWQNITTSANATATTISRWYATGFTASTNSGNMPYSLSNGIGSVAISQPGVYNLAASLTLGESVSGNLIGLFIIESNGVVNAPFAVSGGASSGSTVNVSSVKYLGAGQKIGLAVYNGNASAAATDLSVTATNYTSVKLSGFLVG